MDISRIIRPTLINLPDEVLLHILFHLDAEETLLSVQLITSQFYTLVQEPLLWRYHCRNDFHYWDEKHNIQQRFCDEVENTDWWELYLNRKAIDVQTSRILDDILSEQIWRIRRTERITEFGYDAKDTLLRNAHAPAHAEDVLARRFQANTVVDAIHRLKALDEWQKLRQEEEVTIERALGAFDMFFLHENRGDLAEISEMIDELRDRLLTRYPQFGQWPLRQRALMVVRFLRDSNFTGVSDNTRYRDFQNNFISAALQDPNHPSLPLISAAIYCALARRLGLNAAFVNFPGHIHATVRVEDDEALSRDETTEERWIYLDPFNSEEEEPMEKLRTELQNIWNIPPHQQESWLAPVPVTAMIQRSTRNILSSIENEPNPNDWIHSRNSNYSNPLGDLADAVYASYWASFMLERDGAGMRRYLPTLLKLYQEGFPMDGCLIERFVLEKSLFIDDRLRHRIQEEIRVVRATDQMLRPVKSRDGSGFSGNVKYRIGQVFRHRRQGYIAAIVGWDEQCNMPNQWIRQHGVDSLPRGRSQSFYHSL